ncbi:MAG: hypothetical protein M0Z31_13175 [Clostridia bacterium]|nr:hypothetical protein [Clostridia bacterium]
MNKGKLLTVAVISGVLMAGSALQALAGTSGYETYKSALKNTKAAQSLTSQVKVTLQDNGNTILSADSVTKKDLAKDAASNTVSINSDGKSATFEMFQQDDQMVMKRSGEDVYYQVEKGGHKQRKAKAHDEELHKDMENVIDALTQNLQNQITIQEGEKGTKKIDLQLTGTEIPLAVNAVGSMLVKHVPQAHEKAQDMPKPFAGIKPELPRLKDAIQVKEIRLSAEVSADNYIEEHTATIVVSGKDAQGNAHDLTFNLEADLSDFNQTTVTPVDIAGKKVETISMKHGKLKKH